MSELLQAIGFFGIMLAGSMADSQDLKPFLVVCMASMLSMIIGLLIDSRKTVRRNKRSDKFNYYFR